MFGRGEAFIMNLFRQELYQYNEKLKEIEQINENNEKNRNSDKVNNTFFSAFDSFVNIINSYYYAKTFPKFNISNDLKEKIKNCSSYIENVFKFKKVKDQSTSFSNDVNKISEKFSSEWKNYIQKETTNIVNELNTYYLVCNEKSVIKQYINHIEEMQKLPLNMIKINQYKNNCEIIKDKLKKLHFSEPIELFLKKVQANLATLSDLTEEVIKWIKDNHIEDNILLNFKKI